jgi:hypothetical protein
MRNHLVVGLPIELEGDYDNLSDKEKYELACHHPEGSIFDDVSEFFHYLNMDMIDTENKYWYLLKWE